MSAFDYEVALQLQEQFENEVKVEKPSGGLSYSNKANKENKSLTDPSWELIDPTPDIYVLFRLFNEKYFWYKLLTVCVDWSKRMTSCAGICSYQGYGGLCKITLSEPLLKLRPRKDLIETLLHEMIHAYLFVTHNNKDRDGHGPEFHKHMYRINAEAGTKITVYHTFHDEVRLYQQHWWRCNGPCQQRKPFFGMVRRAMNRAPGPYDRWWAEHQTSCGGTFIKVKEPEKVQKATAKNKKNINTNSKDIRSFYPVLSTKNLNQDLPKANIKTIQDINTQGACGMQDPIKALPKVISAPTPFAGTGVVLSVNGSKKGDVSSVVRDHWAKKFVPTKRSPSPCNKVVDKKQKVAVHCPVCDTEVDGDLNSHLDACLIENQTTLEMKTCDVCDLEVDSRVYDCHLAKCLQRVFNEESEDVVEVPVVEETIPCLVCNKPTKKSELNLHLDECMSDKVFNGRQDVADVVEVPTNTNKYNCPICFEMFNVTEMSVHLDQCLSSSEISNNDNFVNEMWEDTINLC